MWDFLSAYLDENSRGGKYYKISVSHTKIPVHKKFPPTLIRQSNVAIGSSRSLHGVGRVI